MTAAVLVAAFAAATATPRCCFDASGHGFFHWCRRVEQCQGRAQPTPELSRYGRREATEPVKCAGNYEQSNDDSFNHDGPHPRASAIRHVRNEAR